MGGRRRLVLLFGVIALCSAYGEGAMADWGALHLHLDLHTSVALAAAGYASFSAAMVAGRLSGAWMLARAGRTLVLSAGALTAAAGMLLAALVPTLAPAIVGFTLVGLGLANLFPAALGEAGALAGPNGVAAASTLGYTGFLVSPPIIGFLAERVGLRAALTTISLLAAIAAAVAVAARRAQPA
jgi:MFS family permease